jgi:PAS domain S-box-containing protein
VRPRHIAPAALVLGLTVAGFLLAGLLAERAARRDSEHRAEVAAAQVRGRVEQGASLAESLRRFMLDTSGTGVTSDQFARNALRWLSPAGFAAAAWVEQVPDSRRAAYERRIGQPIVTPDERRRVVPAGSRSSYLPATLVSGFDPMAVPGIDLSGEPGMATVLTRATRRDGVAATPVSLPRPGTSGLFLVGPAPNLIGGVLHPGYVVVFVSGLSLRAAATDTPGVQVAASGTSTGAREGTKTVRKTFTAAGQRFDVVVPEDSVHGAAAILPWIILAAGLVLAGLAAALGVNATRRAKAQDELDRIFNLSSDLIAVADFEGHFTRVNPAAEQVLGYTQEELLARPYLDFVHPDDRGETAAEASAIAHGKSALSFENRYVRKDGSVRVLEWTSTPVIEDRAMYGVARDVTERRQAETELERLADEQAALRRVAMLVAEDVPSSELFLAVTREVGTLLGGDFSGMIRYDDGTVATVATWAAIGEHPPVPDRWPIAADDAATIIAETREPARVDDWAAVPGPMAAFIREELGVSSSVGSPIVVEGRLWGALAVHSKQRQPLPPDTEARLRNFTELVATAISNIDARAEAARLAQEQAALRRVAELVAREASQVEVFRAIAEEIGRLLGTEEMRMLRYEDDGSAIVVGSSGDEDAFPLGSRLSLEGDTAASRVLRMGRTARIDDYRTMSGPLAETARSIGVRSAVGAPIVVEGRLWGAMVTATTQDKPLPPATEFRLGQFTELMVTAIANAEARAEVERLADEQAALRRVATLVAQGASPSAVLDTVAAEMERVLGADGVTLSRYEPDEEVIVVAHSGSDPRRVPPGTRVSHQGENVTSLVRRSKRSARMEHRKGAHGAIAQLTRTAGVRASVGAPIVVEGRLWGVAIANWRGEESPPADTEERMAQFAELLDTAIANADSRDQLTASRARLVTEGDEARRRVVRDLHDGAQQRLVHTIVTLKLARRALRENNGEAESLVGEALEQAQQGNAELRELAHGILPAILTHGGLRAGVDTVVARYDLPVQVDVPAERFPAEIEASAYFIVAEALTNVMKHAHAESADVKASVQDGMLHVEVRDDGIGGADPGGHGLVGMGDRVTALGGRLKIDSPAGGGTLVAATLPLSGG